MGFISSVGSTFKTDSGRVFGIVVLVFLSLIFIGLVVRIADRAL